MEISRETPAESKGTTSIRLRYSRQFQNAGHAHTIDAETTLAVGASSEKREQVIRELEAGVEQLARQIVQRGTRPTAEPRLQAAPRPASTANRTTEQAAPASPRPVAAQPAAPVPVSESMPSAPTASGERTINLPQFIDYIKKRWNMSPQEAMELLDVRELTSLNYRDALFTLRAIKEPHAATNPGAGQARPTQQQPVVEAPRQTSRNTPAAPNSQPPANRHIPSNPSISRAPASAAPPALATAPEREQTVPEREHRSLPDFAGSSKAPLPIQLGVVRDVPRPVPASYGFDEEDEEGYDLPADDENEEETANRKAAVKKLEELKNMRSGGSSSSAASPERLIVLNNVLDGQISEEQLEQLILAVWNVTNKKRLKVPQVEGLISWAKEDYFANEVENLLALLNEGEK